MKGIPTPSPQQPAVQVRGRISARKLIDLHCRACGRDLLPVLAQALLHGCECQRRPQLRVVQ